MAEATSCHGRSAWKQVDALHRDARDRVTEVKILDIELHVRMDELSTLKRVGRSRAGGARVSQLPHRKNRLMGVYSGVNRGCPGRDTERKFQCCIGSYGKRSKNLRYRCL